MPGLSRTCCGIITFSDRFSGLHFVQGSKQPQLVKSDLSTLNQEKYTIIRSIYFRTSGNPQHMWLFVLFPQERGTKHDVISTIWRVREVRRAFVVAISRFHGWRTHSKPGIRQKDTLDIENNHGWDGTCGRVDEQNSICMYWLERRSILSVGRDVNVSMVTTWGAAA